MNDEKYTKKIINTLEDIRNTENVYLVAKISAIILSIIACIPAVISYDFFIDNIKIIIAIMVGWIIPAYILNYKFLKSIPINKIDNLTMIAITSDEVIHCCFNLHCHNRNGKIFLHIQDFLNEINRQHIQISLEKTALMAIKKL